MESYQRQAGRAQRTAAKPVDELVILHQYRDQLHNCVLYTNGRFTVNGVDKPWYKDGEQPWLVKTFQQFKSLCKQAIREGDFD